MILERRLLPREHGAYAQLLFPLLSALLMGKPTAPAIGFVAAAILLFLVNEPVAILLGVRGARLRRDLTGLAWRQIYLLGSGGLLAGFAALASAPADARMLALIPLVFCAVLAALVFRGRLKTLAGEILVAAAFASMHLPVGYASGLRLVSLWGPAVIWFVIFIVGALSVHAIKSRREEGVSWTQRVALVGSAVASLSGLALAFLKTGLQDLGLALLAPAAVVLGVNLMKVRPHSLKQVGWSIVAANTVALIVLIVAGG